MVNILVVVSTTRKFDDSSPRFRINCRVVAFPLPSPLRPHLMHHQTIDPPQKNFRRQIPPLLAAQAAGDLD